MDDIQQRKRANEAEIAGHQAEIERLELESADIRKKIGAAFLAGRGSHRQYDELQKRLARIETERQAIEKCRRDAALLDVQVVILVDVERAMLEERQRAAMQRGQSAVDAIADHLAETFATLRAALVDIDGYLKALDAAQKIRRLTARQKIFQSALAEIRRGAEVKA